MKILKYPTDANVLAFSTMRHGGAGGGSYSSFNITHYCGDNPENVSANRAILCSHLGIEEEKLILPHQTHGTEILEIDRGFLSLDAHSRTTMLYGVDAVCSREKGICIGVSTADCIPMLLYDNDAGLVAAIHAGWRGTVADIVTKSILAMKLSHNINPATTKAIIGPGISLSAFEVGDEVYEAFKSAAFPMDKIARRYGEKWHIDLPEANRLQLLACGLCATNIFLSGVCTFSSHDDFFSARRLGVNSGRIFNGIMMV